MNINEMIEYLGDDLDKLEKANEWNGRGGWRITILNDEITFGSLELEDALDDAVLYKQHNTCYNT